MISDFELFENIKMFEWLLDKKHFYSCTKHSPLEDGTKGQGRILAILAIEDGLKTKDLALRTGISCSSLNEVLARLEKQGYINRLPSKKDKRVIINCLTEKGKCVIPKHFDYSIFDCLNEYEKEEFLIIFGKLNSYLENSFEEIEDKEVLENFKERKKAFEEFLKKQTEIISSNRKENLC